MALMSIRRPPIYLYDPELLKNPETECLIANMRNFKKFKLRPLCTNDYSNSKYSLNRNKFIRYRIYFLLYRIHWTDVTTDTNGTHFRKHVYEWVVFFFIFSFSSFRQSVIYYYRFRYIQHDETQRRHILYYCHRRHSDPYSCSVRYVGFGKKIHT